MGQPALKLVETPEVEIHGVPFNAVPEVWEVVEPMIQKGIDQFPEWAGHDLVDIRAEIENRTMQLWLVLIDNKPAAAFTSSIEVTPQIKTFNIHLGGGGKMKLWVAPLWDVFNQYAKDMGCQKIRGFGREGWIKVLGVKPEEMYMWQVEVK
jgi:hypothetical protein